jgi:hypothetical protein
MPRTNESPTQDTKISEDVLTLTKEEIQLLSQPNNDKKLPHISPIGKRTLTKKDLEETIKAWREKNGCPQVPLSSWWQEPTPWRQGPHLGGANLTRRKLNEVDLSGVILSDAQIEGTFLYEAKLVGTWLSRANLSNARLSRADASGAVFYETDLTEAEFFQANLNSTKFTGAILERTRLLDSNLNGAYFFRARLNNTEMMASQIGQEIGEEKDRLYSEAIEAYSRLKANFESIGRDDDAGWAYRKERRMRKLFAAQQAQIFWTEKSFSKAVSHYIKFLKDWFIELLCDYGESPWRVVFWMAMLFFVIGPLSISLLGGLEVSQARSPSLASQTDLFQKSLYIYSQYLLHMLDTFTTADYSKTEPVNDAVRLASGLISMMAIFLLGLLGFVAGNRIRNS